MDCQPPLTRKREEVTRPDNEPAPIENHVGEVSDTERHFEWAVVIVLAMAALATAWSSYQASLWDGIQSSNYTQASAARTDSDQRRTEANQFRLADLTVIENWIDATIDGDAPLADFYFNRFREEFQPAFDAWIALDPLDNPDAPASPLGMAEYVLADDLESDELREHAQELFFEGEAANSISDTYTLTTLLFAVSLFFAAISERFDYHRVRWVLFGMASLGLVTGIIIALNQPITTG